MDCFSPDFPILYDSIESLSLQQQSYVISLLVFIQHFFQLQIFILVLIFG